MNGKQAKMLRRMRADNGEIKAWKQMNADEKGRLRLAFNLCPWMMHPSFSDTVAAANRI